MSTVPAVTPVTIPELFIVATETSELDHVPPDVASVKEIVLLTQTLPDPVIAATAGIALIVNVAVLPEEGKELHPTNAISVMVISVEPRFVAADAMKVPLDAPKTIVAVFPVDVFAPFRS